MTPINLNALGTANIVNPDASILLAQEVVVALRE